MKFFWGCRSISDRNALAYMMPRSTSTAVQQITSILHALFVPENFENGGPETFVNSYAQFCHEL
jgi:hypothetical protein